MVQYPYNIYTLFTYMPLWLFISLRHWYWYNYKPIRNGIVKTQRDNRWLTLINYEATWCWGVFQCRSRV